MPTQKKRVMRKERQTIDHDRLFKELLTTFFIEFVDLFLPDVAEYLDRDFDVIPLDKEFLADAKLRERHEVDLLMKVKFKGKDAYFLIHVENQATAQSDFPSRMYGYFSRLTLKYKLPVYPVVIFSYDAPARPEPTYFEVTFPKKRILRFDYTIIQLNRLSWRKFVRRDNPVANALMTKMKIAPKDRPKVRAECLRMLARLQLDPARATLIGVFLDSYLTLTAAEMKPFERELGKFTPEERETAMELMTSWERIGLEQGLTQGLEQGLTQGLEQGLTQGLEQGLTQGQHEGRAVLVTRQIRKRLGLTPLDLTARLDRLTSSELDDLGEALLDFTSVSDLEQWLSSHETTSRI